MVAAGHDDEEFLTAIAACGVDRPQKPQQKMFLKRHGLKIE